MQSQTVLEEVFPIRNKQTYDYEHETLYRDNIFRWNQEDVPRMVFEEKSDNWIARDKEIKKRIKIPLMIYRVSMMMLFLFYLMVVILSTLTSFKNPVSGNLFFKIGMLILACIVIGSIFMFCYNLYRDLLDRNYLLRRDNVAVIDKNTMIYGRTDLHSSKKLYSEFNVDLKKIRYLKFDTKLGVLKIYADNVIQQNWFSKNKTGFLNSFMLNKKIITPFSIVLVFGTENNNKLLKTLEERTGVKIEYCH